MMYENDDENYEKKLSMHASRSSFRFMFAVVKCIREYNVKVFLSEYYHPLVFKSRVFRVSRI